MRLREIEQESLAPALREAVAATALRTIDSELGTFVDESALTRLASFGVRGEVVFPIPSLLRANPRLLRYYRLLYGVSKKDWRDPPWSAFLEMEGSSTLKPEVEARLSEFCNSLCETGRGLVMGLEEISVLGIRDLQLLTLGGQFRGAVNVEIGQAAVRRVFDRIVAALDPAAVVHGDPRRIELRNSSGRVVTIRFGSDPDIAVEESQASGIGRKVAIEVKGGKDSSNIHERLGAAEKSHLKARRKGFAQCWTIYNAKVTPDRAKEDSPSTNEFFTLSGILDDDHSDWLRFQDRLTSELGVPVRGTMP